MNYVTLNQIIKKFNFKIITGTIESSKNVKVKSRGINKGGLELTGFFHRKDKNKCLIFGSKENEYIKTLSKKEISNTFSRIFKNKIPVVIFTKNTKVSSEIIKAANKNNGHILQSKFGYTDTAFQIAQFLNENISKTEQFHGTLMQIYGKGILITGNSGVGKSETALELIKKGHLFVVDDGTQVRRVGSNIIGKSPSTIQNLLEVRGLGIIDVSTLFGSAVILESAQIDYVFKLKEYSKNTQFDRLGHGKRFKKIAGLKIPLIQIPISAARNTSSLIEIAVAQLIIKEKGFNPLEVYKSNMKGK